ncbi:MAG: hypothetical protein HN348_11520 [Proteobacteria bacterium]|nr:hypothetical protein [Pseudomonadota bacterium]
MDLNTGVLLALIAFLGVNQSVARVSVLRGIAVLFWGVQLLNVVVSLGVLIFGLPGFDHIPIVSWVVGLLFLVHIAHNTRVRMKAGPRLGGDDLDKKKEEIRAALKD